VRFAFERPHPRVATSPRSPALARCAPRSHHSDSLASAFPPLVLTPAARVPADDAQPTEKPLSDAEPLDAAPTVKISLASPKYLGLAVLGVACLILSVSVVVVGGTGETDPVQPAVPPGSGRAEGTAASEPGACGSVPAQPTRSAAAAAPWPADWHVGLDASTSDGNSLDELSPGTRGPACSGCGGTVASTNNEATQAGLKVLAAGGNAADAAFAVQLMLNVAQPESTGLGGGCFILNYDAASGEVVTIDGREEAPEQYHSNVFCSNAECGTDPGCPACPEGPLGGWGATGPATGGLAVGVPGTLAAAARLLEDHGTRSMAELAGPAIKTAREGITMTHHCYNAIHSSLERLRFWAASKALFLTQDGAECSSSSDCAPPQECKPGLPGAPRLCVAPIAQPGALWTNPDLASTFERLSTVGWADFYTGTIAREVVDAVQNAVNPTNGRNGMMTYEDIAGYKAVKRAPTRVDFNPRGASGEGGGEGETYTIFGMNMPSSGGATMGMIFNLLEVAIGRGEYSPFSYLPSLHILSSQLGNHKNGFETRRGSNFRPFWLEPSRFYHAA
jgi:hypothetical protein